MNARKAVNVVRTIQPLILLAIGDPPWLQGGILVALDDSPHSRLLLIRERAAGQTYKNILKAGMPCGQPIEFESILLQTIEQSGNGDMR